MDIQTAKQIRIADYLYSLGYSPVKQQGINLWYKSPLREETEASFKVNTERNQWYDFALGKGGGIIELATGALLFHLHIPYILESIEEQTPHIRPVSFSFGKQSFSEPSFQQLEIVPLFFSCPALLFAGKGNKKRNWQKENAVKRISPTTANGISPLPFPTYRAAMRFATDISKVVSPQKISSHISDSREKRGKRVMCSRDLWTIFHF